MPTKKKIAFDWLVEKADKLASDKPLATLVELTEALKAKAAKKSAEQITERRARLAIATALKQQARAKRAGLSSAKQQRIDAVAAAGEQYKANGGWNSARG